jgi:hypothetical protein
MVNETTVSKLVSIKLSVMAEHFREQLKSPSFIRGPLKNGLVSLSTRSGCSARTIIWIN